MCDEFLRTSPCGLARGDVSVCEENDFHRQVGGRARRGPRRQRRSHGQSSGRQRGRHSRRMVLQSAQTRQKEQEGLPEAGQERVGP